MNPPTGAAPFPPAWDLCGVTHLNLIVRFCAEYLLWVPWERGALGRVQELGSLPQVSMSFPLNYDNVDRIVLVQDQVNCYQFFFLLLLESGFEPAPAGDSDIWE